MFLGKPLTQISLTHLRLCLLVVAVASGILCVLTFSGFTQWWGYDFQQLWGVFLLFNVQVE